jgi:hypothetical protein
MKNASAIAILLSAGGWGAAHADESNALSEFVRISPRDPRYFELTDGRAYIPIGLNVVSVRSAPDGAEGLARMEQWMKELSRHGGNFLRVWLSSPFWDIEHERCGMYDPDRGERIDALLKMARKYGIRLKLTIEHFREIDPESGYSRTWALKPLHHVTRGGTALSMADWFAGSKSRQQFQKKLDWYANRYGSDPIIFGWELYVKDRAGIILHDVIFAPFFAGAAGTGHCWHWDAYVHANNLWWHFGRFAAAVEGLDPPAEKFEPLVIDHPRLRVYVLRGKQTTLAWCRDKQNTWRTELAESIAPAVIRDASIDFGQIASSHGTEVRVYDPWQNNWTEAHLEGHTVRLPAFSRSVLVRIAEGG